jgi:hypothetical protein
MGVVLRLEKCRSWCFMLRAWSFMRFHIALRTRLRELLRSGGGPLHGG